MRIVLMRHGKPLLPSPKPMSSIEFKDWINVYNTADLCENLKPTKAAVQLVQSCNTIVCSSLPRSISSARLLGINEISLIEHQLREMELPWGELYSCKLKPTYWAILFRTLWFLGYSKHSESFNAAKLRAKQAALLLESRAKPQQTLLFIGHGLLNRFIAHYLVQRGWKTQKQASFNYWDFGVFEYEI